jgi:hypothetical protein
MGALEMTRKLTQTKDGHLGTGVKGGGDSVERS